MRTPLLELRDVSLQFGGIKALEGVGFAGGRGSAALSLDSLAAIGARLKETAKLGARVVQLAPNELLEGTRQIDDPRSGE